MAHMTKRTTTKATNTTIIAGITSEVPGPVAVTSSALALAIAAERAVAGAPKAAAVSRVASGAGGATVAETASRGRPCQERESDT